MTLAEPLRCLREATSRDSGIEQGRDEHVLISLTQRENRVLLDDACGRRLRTGHHEIGHAAAFERRGALDELLLFRGDRASSRASRAAASFMRPRGSGVRQLAVRVKSTTVARASPTAIARRRASPRSGPGQSEQKKGPAVGTSGTVVTYAALRAHNSAVVRDRGEEALLGTGDHAALRVDQNSHLPDSRCGGVAAGGERLSPLLGTAGYEA